MFYPLSNRKKIEKIDIKNYFFFSLWLWGMRLLSYTNSSWIVKFKRAVYEYIKFHLFFNKIKTSFPKHGRNRSAPQVPKKGQRCSVRTKRTQLCQAIPSILKYGAKFAFWLIIKYCYITWWHLLNKCRRIYNMLTMFFLCYWKKKIVYTNLKWEIMNI